MHPDKNSAKQPQVDEAAMESAVRRVLSAIGAIAPETDEDVAWAEANIDEAGIDLPDALKSPPASAVQFGLQNTDQPNADAMHTPAGENLARAARNGKTIPPEILEKMARDREAAERQSEADGND